MISRPFAILPLSKALSAACSIEEGLIAWAGIPALPNCNFLTFDNFLVSLCLSFLTHTMGIRVMDTSWGCERNKPDDPGRLLTWCLPYSTGRAQ